VEVDAEGGVDVFGDHAARAEDVGPLVLGPPRRSEDVGAGATVADERERRERERSSDEPLLSEDKLLSSSLFVPAGLNRHLREYQREGVRFLYRLFASGKGGVLADDMGLGKTVQTVAFLGSVLRSPVAIRDERAPAARAGGVPHLGARQLGGGAAAVGRGVRSRLGGPGRR
jgi:hypothetical protein